MRHHIIRRTAAASLLVGAVLPALAVGPSAARGLDTPSTRTAPGSSAAPAADEGIGSVVLRLSFGATTGDVTSPRVTGPGAAAVTSSVLTNGDGRATTVTGFAGSALSLPDYTPLGPSTPLAVVRLGLTDPQAADPLDPAARPFSWAADFSIDNDTGNDPTDGDNLFQRGLTPDTLWKLQVDHHVVSCGLKSKTMPTAVYTNGVRIGQQDESAVQNRTWYRATCTRDADGVLSLVLRQRSAAGSFRTIARTQTAAGSAAGRMTMSGAIPVSIGGKLNVAGTGLNSQPDQFNGLVDNVRLRIG